MSGVEVHIALDVAAAQAALARLTAGQIDQLAYEIGTLVEDQTKLRINDDKTAPDGTPWAPWSERYAASLKRRNRVNPRSLLLGVGDLRDSVQNYTKGETVTVGSNLIYAAIHQFGGEAVGKNIPARPYLGLSTQNATDIEAFVTDRLEDLLQ